MNRLTKSIVTQLQKQAAVNSSFMKESRSLISTASRIAKKHQKYHYPPGLVATKDVVVILSIVSFCMGATFHSISKSSSPTPKQEKEKYQDRWSEKLNGRLHNQNLHDYGGCDRQVPPLSPP